MTHTGTRSTGLPIPLERPGFRRMGRPAMIGTSRAHRFARLGNRYFLPSTHLIKKPRTVGFGRMNIDGLHPNQRDLRTLVSLVARSVNP